jgi:hypothetical protein
MNEEAGRGGLLVLTLRSEKGEEWPFAVDTACAKTGFDRSLQAKLGNSVGSNTFWNFGSGEQGLLFAPPKLFLGHTLLKMNSSTVSTYDCRGASSYMGRPIMGILGMDILRNYCIQLDFQTRRIRFLDDETSDKQGWGEGFSLVDAGDGCFCADANLAGLRGAGSLIDTGCLHDGWLRPELYQQWTNKSVPPENGECRVPDGILGGEHYPEIDLNWLEQKFLAGHDLHMQFNGIGIQFLSLHLVTLDFPQRTMYLKRTAEKSPYSSAVRFLRNLWQDGRLPGWSQTEAMPPSQVILHFHFSNSGTFDALKSGDPSLYHYTVSRENEAAGWKLEKAWRTNPAAKQIEEYPVR